MPVKFGTITNHNSRAAKSDSFNTEDTYVVLMRLELSICNERDGKESGSANVITSFQLVYKNNVNVRPKLLRY